MPDDRPAVEEVKRALAGLAADEPIARSRATVEIGTEAIEDVERAAAFATADGPTRLASAIELAKRTDDRRLVREGQRALAAFERFRNAVAEDPNRSGDHYHRAHGTNLMEETKRGDR